MKEGCNLASRFRFSKFEVDLSSGELLKGGYRVKLQPQPFQVLVTLLQRPGEVITREDLRSRVWPSDTYVDFDHSLNKAVNKIREALGDSTDHPHYVETMARRGYRFIAPVEVVNGAQDAPVLVPPPQIVPRRTRRSAWIVAACLFAAALAVVGWALRPTKKSEPVLTRLTSDPGLTTDPSIAPDGRLIAYASDRGSDHLHIWVQQLSPGGQAVQLTKGDADDLEPAFSPDGERIVFRSERDGGGIYLVAAIGGTPVLITKEGRNPRFSPDGKWIAYWTGLGWLWIGCTTSRGKVFIVSAAGGPSSEVRTDLSQLAVPVWSSDAKHLLVLGRKKSPEPDRPVEDWWVVPAEGGPAAQTGAYASFVRQGLRLRSLDTVPFPREWHGGNVLSSVMLGDSLDLWQVPITWGTWRIDQPAERVSSVPGSALSGTTAPDGRIAFANVSSKMHLWSLRADPDRSVVTGLLQQLTDSGTSETWPSISLDGRFLTFSLLSSGSYDVWMKDLATGKQVPLAATRASEDFPRISPDGSAVAYRASEGEQSTTLITPVDVPQGEKIFQPGEWVWSWSPDRRYLLCVGADGPRVRLFDLRSRKFSDLLVESGGGLYQATFSPDGRWITFMDSVGVWVVPFRGPGLIPKESWLQITSGGNWDDKPRWSPNGNTILFTSDRDGISRCIWAQQLDPRSKRPVGDPKDLYHLHDPHRSLLAAGYPYSELAVARDKLVFPLGEVTGNIWMVQPRR